MVESEFICLFSFISTGDCGFTILFYAPAGRMGDQHSKAASQWSYCCTLKEPSLMSSLNKEAAENSISPSLSSTDAKTCQHLNSGTSTLGGPENLCSSRWYIKAPVEPLIRQ